MRRVLLLIPSTSYRATDFLEAAARLDIDVVVGSDHRQVLEGYSKGRTLTVSFNRLEESVGQIVARAKRFPFTAIIGVDEETTLLAARASHVLTLAHNSESSVAVAHDKHLLRQTLEQAGLRCPWYHLISPHEILEKVARQAQYPCVLKPLTLSGSRGVIRADNPNGFVKAGHRIRRMLGKTEGRSSTHVLVEKFIPGREVALEGLLDEGRLKVLALFDKPDPLDGPFFEETIYVTPSRLSTRAQDTIRTQTETAARALGLETGAVHAELRLNEEGPWIIEIGARTIGGLCSRSLRFSARGTLEELVLRHALGESTADITPLAGASGVMMIPISKAGQLKSVTGLEQARAVAAVNEVVVTIPIGESLVPIPEGGRYLGFIFSRAARPEDVESALRVAHSKLGFVIK